MGNKCSVTRKRAKHIYDERSCELKGRNSAKFGVLNHNHNNNKFWSIPGGCHAPKNRSFFIPKKRCVVRRKPKQKRR